VVTYIKDIYPEIDQKVYSIAREIGKRLGKAPELEELAKIYGMEIKSLEDKLRLIEKLLENPVRTPYGEVSLPSFSYPLVECE
jgi:DNA-directed RNA polymerase sigma subunit (sigma70/sigma32)